MLSRPLFSAIVLTYNRPALLRDAVSALRRQTYPQIEIILVNNAATPETVAYLEDVAREEQRVKLVHFTDNQYRPNDPQHVIEVCFNAGLREATGDYVWYQNDDDRLADDYVERMVALFAGHPDCTTAAGLPVEIDRDGRVMDTRTRSTNYRPRYMPGHVLALDVLRGGSRMYGAQGVIFTIKRDVLLAAGGYHRDIEISHLFGIVPFGVTGFDESAIFYSRRHEGQLNTQLSARGWLGADLTYALLKDWQIQRRWEGFGAGMAKEVVAGLKRRACRAAAIWCVRNALSGRFRAAWRVGREVWTRPPFWRALPGQLVKQLRRGFVARVKGMGKPLVRRLITSWPPQAAEKRGLALGSWLWALGKKGKPRRCV